MNCLKAIYLFLLCSVNLIGYSQISIEAPYVESPVCHDDLGFIDLSASVVGGMLPLNFSWEGPGDFIDGPVQTDLPAGLYEVTVTDAEGMIAQILIPLVAPEELIITCEVENAATEDGLGFASCSVSGGAGPFSFVPHDLGNNLFSGGMELPVGGYSITIQDTNGCFAAETFNISVEPPGYGDFDGDGAVGSEDLTVFMSQFGQTCFNCEGDLDNNGVVTSTDIALFLVIYGNTY